jgi:hypothetical protein
MPPDHNYSFPRQEEPAKTPALLKFAPEKSQNILEAMKTAESKNLCSSRPSRVRARLMAVALGLTSLLALAGALRAGGLYVPNYSFALPDIGTNSPYAAPVLEAWQESAQPGWYNPADFGGSPWSDLVGTFYNLPDFTNATETNTSFIDNCVGDQAAFVFALPQVAILQDISATFNAGHTYTLTVGLIGGGGGMTNGSTFELSLYYLDGTNIDIIQSTTVTNTEDNFPTDTNFVDFQVQVPGVLATDRWAGKNIGIQLLATPDFDNPGSWGGYWDVGNVRLAEGIYVPNYSFELPNIGTNSPYAAPVFDSWEEAPQPSWYVPADFGGSPWADLMGTFYNLPNFTNAMGTNSTYIYNCDGVQAAFLFVIPQVAIFQDFDSIGEDTNVAEHAFNATYNVGKAYTLTVGLMGGGGGMVDGSTFQLSLYYLDGTNMDTVAETTVTNTAANFPDDEHLVDFQVQVPGVHATDPWAGQHIGIQLMATPDFDNPGAWGGFWDADNVRLVETTPLNLANPASANGQLQFTVQSEPNVVFQILATTNLSLPVTNWTSLATLTNTTGSLPFVDTTAGLQQRFYTAQQSP